MQSRILLNVTNFLLEFLATRFRPLSARPATALITFSLVRSLRRRLRHHSVLRKDSSGLRKFVVPYRFQCSRSEALLSITLPIVSPREPLASPPSDSFKTPKILRLPSPTCVPFSAKARRSPSGLRAGRWWQQFCRS